MRALALLVATVAVAGCGGGDGSPSKEGIVPVLKDQGIAASVDRVDPPGVLNAGSTVYHVPGGELHVFRFGSAESALKASALVEPDGYTVNSESGIKQVVDWAAPPHWFRDGRQVAVYVGSSAEVIDALEAAAGAQFAGA
jgi:hypothetical protein